MKRESCWDSAVDSGAKRSHADQISSLEMNDIWAIALKIRGKPGTKLRMIVLRMVAIVSPEEVKGQSANRNALIGVLDS
jgi:hypothetical protein